MSGQMLHPLVRAGDLAAVVRLCVESDDPAALVNEPDYRGVTPLACALRARRIRPGVVGVLLEMGAEPNVRLSEEEGEQTPLAISLYRGSLEAAELLLDYGADLKLGYERSGSAFLTACKCQSSERLLEVIELLAEHGADPSVTEDGHAAIHILATHGRFDVVLRLLELGADDTELKWSPLHWAAAFGSAEDVQSAVDQGGDLHALDSLGSTPVLVAIARGDLQVVRLLADRMRGPSPRHRFERAMETACTAGRAELIPYLAGEGVSVERKGFFGFSPLTIAIQYGHTSCVRALVACGARLDRESFSFSLLRDAGDERTARMLIRSGLPSHDTSTELRQMMIGASDYTYRDLAYVPSEEYQRARHRRFGESNPEEFHEPFWEMMIRTGCTAYSARKHFNDLTKFSSGNSNPVWCAHRFGQSITFLPDGRIVQIGGEHEDSYDPDFCIYNDVFVHEPDGQIRIFGYPRDVFPPTDFHSATLAGKNIYVIGRLGYKSDRNTKGTPVFRLDTETFQMESLTTTGDAPHQIHGHWARLLPDGKIRIWKGRVTASFDRLVQNKSAYVLDLETRHWTRLT